MAKYVLADTGFWFAIFESRDTNHEEALIIADLIENQNVLIPWPSLYETMNTRFTKRTDRMMLFKSFISKPNVSLLDDSKYKDYALNSTFGNSRIGKRTFSLVDSIIRELLKDQNLKIDYLITFNKGDFIDLCQIRKIELYE
jgi:predicted nucleic acid-binding protein